MPRQALAKHDRPRVIHPHRVKHVLCEIDPEDGHLLLHWTRLLWLNGFPNLLELIVAHCSRSAQGAGPFHYDLVEKLGHLKHGDLVASQDLVQGGIRMNLASI